MIWPFKKKESKYNELRRSVGMAPASDDDFAEAVAFIIVLEVLAQEVADECKRFPVEERGVFMMTYASYLCLLAMRGVESKFPRNSWNSIAPLLSREFSKQPWYKAEVMARILDSIIESPPTEARGRTFNASTGPWNGIVMATEIAGYSLSYSDNLEFLLYVNIISNKVLDTIGKIAAQAS